MIRREAVTGYLGCRERRERVDSKRRKTSSPLEAKKQSEEEEANAFFYGIFHL